MFATSMTDKEIIFILSHINQEEKNQSSKNIYTDKGHKNISLKRKYK